MSGSLDGGRWVSGCLIVSGGLDSGHQVDAYVGPTEGDQVAWIRESFRG